MFLNVTLSKQNKQFSCGAGKLKGCIHKFLESQEKKSTETPVRHNETDNAIQIGTSSISFPTIQRSCNLTATTELVVKEEQINRRLSTKTRAQIRQIHTRSEPQSTK